MKRMIFLVAFTIPLMAGIMFTGYQSSTQKKEVAQAPSKMIALNAAQKSEMELKIKANENRIAELKIKIKKPAELLDTFYIKKIANLEKENRYLNTRLEAF
jgi:hypothetical protein